MDWRREKNVKRFENNTRRISGWPENKPRRWNTKQLKDDLKRQEEGKTAELERIQEKLTENVSEKLMALYEQEKKVLIKLISEEQKKFAKYIQRDTETLSEL